MEISEGSVNDEKSKSPTEPQLIRITSHLKMSACVAYALSFLETNEGTPLVFHTLPATPNPAMSPTIPPATIVTPVSSNSLITSTVPRMISIVEIVKREFVKALAANHSPRLLGLHQYNEFGCFEDLDVVGQSIDEHRTSTLVAALQGKNHVQRNQTPYMKVTLSHHPLPELVEKGATYQPPTIRKVTKSAKARLKKRERAVKNSKDIDPGDNSNVDTMVSS